TDETLVTWGKTTCPGEHLRGRRILTTLGEQCPDCTQRLCIVRLEPDGFTEFHQSAVHFARGDEHHPEVLVRQRQIGIYRDRSPHRSDRLLAVPRRQVSGGEIMAQAAVP